MDFRTAALLLALLLPHLTAQAGHFPWDQGHETFLVNTPPPPEEDLPPPEDNQPCAGDPVNLRTGAFVYFDTAHDLVFPELGPELALRFTYHSRDRYSGPFGNGWHTSWMRPCSTWRAWNKG